MTQEKAPAEMALAAASVVTADVLKQGARAKKSAVVEKFWGAGPRPIPSKEVNLGPGLGLRSQPRP